MSSTRVARAESATGSSTAAGPRLTGRDRAVRGLLTVAAYITVQTLFLLVLRVLSPRFFWLDDQQAQYTPAFHWLGSTLQGGRPALLDPEAGAGGNYLADPQYGVLDPTHWLISWVVSRFDTVLNAAWLLGGGSVVLLGTGITLVLLTLRARPALAVAAAVGAASSGYFLWVGSSWWPVMWGTAWLPWLWLGLVLPRWPGVLVTAVAAWQLTASGYPYVLVPAAGLVVLHVIERWRRGRLRPELGLLVARGAAGLGGVVVGSPGLIGSQEMVEASTRSEPPVTAVGNVGTLIPNVADTLLGGVTLTPSVSGWAGGFLFVTPVAATAIFAVGVLALVDWRRAIRHPGVLTAVSFCAFAVLLTQFPTDVGPLRYPMRYLAVTGPALAILAALATSVAPCVDRRRVTVAFGLVGAQFLLAVLRGPALVGWHAVAAVLAAGAVGAAAVVMRGGAGGRATAPEPGHGRSWPRFAASRPARRVAAVLLVLLAAAGAVVSVAAAKTTGARQEDQAGAPRSDEPARQLSTRYAWGVDVQQFRDRSALRDESATALVYGDFWAVDADADQGWDWGVLQGNANLLAGFRPGFGYVAVGHDAWVDRWCQDLFGRADSNPACVSGLLEEVPGLDGAVWLDVLSADLLLASPYTPQPLLDHLRATRAEDGLAGAYGRFVREDDLPGRVTWASPDVDVAATDPGAEPTPFYAGRPGESLRVSTPPEGGRLVLRIPAWPGFRAEVDGEDVEVGAVEETALTIELPGGLSDATVDLYFDPLASRLVAPAAATGVTLVLLALAGDVIVSRRRRTTATDPA